MVEKSQLLIGFLLGAALTTVTVFALFSPLQRDLDGEPSTTSDGAITNEPESTAPPERTLGDLPCEEHPRLSDRIPTQERAFTIPQEFIFSSPPNLRPGDRVDLNLRFPGTFPFLHLDQARELSYHDAASLVLLQNLDVLHWSPNQGLTLSFTVQEVELVLLFLEHAEWFVSQRHPDDERAEPQEILLRSEELNHFDADILRKIREQIAPPTLAAGDSDQGLKSSDSLGLSTNENGQEGPLETPYHCRQDFPKGDRIPSGLRAFQIPDRHLLTMPGDIRPDDRVDLLTRFSSEQLDLHLGDRFGPFPPDEEGVMTILQNVLVLDSAPQKGLTLAMTIKEMELLIFLLDQSDFAVSLRNRDSSDSYPAILEFLSSPLMPTTPQVERRPR